MWKHRLVTNLNGQKSTNCWICVWILHISREMCSTDISCKPDLQRDHSKSAATKLTTSSQPAHKTEQTNKPEWNNCQNNTPLHTNAKHTSFMPNPKPNLLNMHEPTVTNISNTSNSKQQKTIVSTYFKITNSRFTSLIENN